MRPHGFGRNSLGRGGPSLLVRYATLRDLVRKPQSMMFLRPIDIDFTGPHGLEGTLHAERTDIDMAEDYRDEQKRDDAVRSLRDLHPENIRHVKREQQQITRYGDREAGAEGAPKHQLLTRVEAARGCVREDIMVYGGEPQSRRLREGSTRQGGPGYIHRVNHDEGLPAVTVHVYSPRLDWVGQYRLAEDGVVLREVRPGRNELTEQLIADGALEHVLERF